MDQISGSDQVLTFNGPLEAGVRAVAVLGAAYPRAFDLQRLTAYDYLIVHTGRLGGPGDLHPASLIEAPVTEVRRNVVEKALLLMMTRDLVERIVAEDGLRYRAGDTAAVFLDSLQSFYSLRVKERAEWVVQYFGDYGDGAFHDLMRRYFDEWVMEFQAVETSLASAP
jgi:hypothetical protein